MAPQAAVSDKQQCASCFFAAWREGRVGRTHNVQAVAQQQVVHSVDAAPQGVLYRQHRPLRHPLRGSTSGTGSGFCASFASPPTGGGAAGGERARGGHARALHAQTANKRGCGGVRRAQLASAMSSAWPLVPRTTRAAPHKLGGWPATDEHSSSPPNDQARPKIQYQPGRPTCERAWKATSNCSQGSGSQPGHALRAAPSE